MASNNNQCAVLNILNQGRSVSVKSEGITTIAELARTIRGKIPSIDSMQMFLTYDVGSVCKCELKTDDDYETMLMLATMFTPPLVTIHVGTVTDLFGSTSTAPSPPLQCSQNNGFHVQVDTNAESSGGNGLGPRSGSVGNPQSRLKDQGWASQDTGVNENNTSRQFSPSLLNPTTCEKPQQTLKSFFGCKKQRTVPVGVGSDVGTEQQEDFSQSHKSVSQASIGVSSEEYTPRHMTTNWENCDDSEYGYNSDREERFDDSEINNVVLQQEAHERRNSLKLKSKRQRAEREMKGKWFPGITDGVPETEISRPQKEKELMSRSWLTNITGIGQRFPGGVVEFRHELAKNASKIGFHFKYSRNDSKYVNAHCKLKDDDGCGWFVKAKLEPVTKCLVIHQADLKHTCSLSIMRNDTTRMGAKLMAGIIQDKLRGNPSMKPFEYRQEFLHSHGFELPYMKVWRGVEKAKANIFGSFQTSFDELRWYSEAILNTNPGSVVALESEPVTHRFRRFFVAYNGSLQGFKMCRPMLFLDGTHLNNRYKGTILAATAKDGNQGLLPVAIAFVESENTANWVWFIKMIREHVKHNEEILYISDRAGGILSAFNMINQKPLHFYCLWHLMKNLRERYPAKSFSELHKNTMCKYLKDQAYAPTIPAFEAALVPFHQLGGDKSREFLQDLPLEKWCLAFAPELIRYGELTSNAAESFNARILVPRSLPITYCVDAIRCQIMKWFQERRDEGNKWTGALTETMEIKWNKFRDLESSWSIMVSRSGDEYEVLSTPSTRVNINDRTCSCWEWQIAGFPCTHAIAVITRYKLSIHDIIDPYYFNDTYKKVYQSDIHAIPTTERFNHAELNYAEKIQPPNLKKQIGRPKVQRFRKRATAKGPKMKCPRCGETGYHVWETCSKALHVD